VVAALTAAFATLPLGDAKFMTWDRGIEMTPHTQFSAATGVLVFFCDAYCPWQRGSTREHQRTATPVLHLVEPSVANST
jgi:IS30 family transposase